MHQFDARLGREELSGQMRGGAVPRGGEGQPFGLRLGSGDQLGDRGHTERGVHHQHVGNRSDHRDRGEILAEIRRRRIRECRIDRVGDGADEERVAVGRRGADRLGSDVAGSARAVLGDDRLAEPLRNRLRNDPRRDIGRRSRRKPDHDLDQLAGIALCGDRERRDGGCRQQNSSQALSPIHGVSPVARIFFFP